CGLRSCSSMLWLWTWGLSPPDRDRSGGHQSYLRRVCRLKERRETTQMSAQKSKEPCRKNAERLARTDSLLDFSVCSASKMQRDLRGQIRVGSSTTSGGALVGTFLSGSVWSNRSQLTHMEYRDKPLGCLSRFGLGRCTPTISWQSRLLGKPPPVATVKENQEKDKNLIKTGQKREAWRSQEKFKAVAVERGRKTEENKKKNGRKRIHGSKVIQL
nr:hypothetical protein [Tanacetum cinerariifolium]